MKKTLGFLLAFIPVVVFAQADLDEEVNAELDMMYGQTAQQTEVAPEPVMAEPQISLRPAGRAPVTRVQKQPMTVVEASPLTESNAEKMRRARQEAELHTEQKIVEKLEASRMKDEQKRADALFGDRFDKLNGQDQESLEKQTPVVVAAPAPVVDVRGEVSAALQEMEDAKKAKKRKTYMAVSAGMADYPEAVNVKSDYAMGFALGQKIDDHLVVEGAFTYSKFKVEQRQGFYDYNWSYYPRITNMDQYNGSGVVKYQFSEGFLRPEMGALLAYTYRSFADKQFGFSSEKATSQALDFGLMTGVEFEISESLSVGLDLRYMWNLTSQTNTNQYQNPLYQPYFSSDTPIEKLSYYHLAVVGRATF